MRKHTHRAREGGGEREEGGREGEREGEKQDRNEVRRKT